VDPRLARLERLRGSRALPPETDRSIGPLVARFAREQKKLAKSLAGAAEAWEKVVPAPLAEASVLCSLKAGVLAVETASNGASFELGRFLRAGGERRLHEESGGAIRSVRVRVEHRD